MAYLKKLNKQVYAEFLIIFRETKRRSEMPRNGTLSQPLIFCSIRSVRFMGIESPETDAMMLGSNCHHQLQTHVPGCSIPVLYHLASVTKFNQFG